MSKPSGKCVFCGKLEVSKEHVFADWIAAELGKKFSHATHYATVDLNGSAKSYKRERMGDPLTRKVRVACESCNDGWMSTLQKRAKPILSPLLRGDWTGLSPEQLPSLAAWIAMTDLVIEFVLPRTATASPEVRRAFRNDHKVPENWEIWGGRYLDVQDRVHYHSSRPLGPVEGQMFEEIAIHVTSICIGQAAFLVLAGADEGGMRGNPEFLSAHGFIRLWPSESKFEVPNKVLDHAAVRWMHETIANDGLVDAKPLPVFDPVRMA